MPPLKVLAFDTSTASTAVALCTDQGRAREARDDPPAGAHPGHATRLLELARGLLEAAALGWRQVDRVAVGLGPGTFTGLRVGVATARGLALSLGAELVGVSSTLALARAAQLATASPAAAAHLAAAPDPAGSVLALIDARRGEVFAAAYERGKDGMPRELAPPRPLAPELIEELARETARSSGGRARRWLAVGDGALRYGEHLRAECIELAGADSPLHLVSAAVICELGALAPAESAHELVPDYRRRPDAELALAHAGGSAAVLK